MKLAASQALYAHWLSLCEGRSAPERHQLNPSTLRHMLAHVFILDVEPVTGGGYRLPIRISGTRLDALFNRDVRGVEFRDLWSATGRPIVDDVALGVLDDAVPALIGGTAAPPCAPDVSFELLLLPLRCSGRTHAQMLGGLAVTTTPSWLGLQAVRPLEATTLRVLHGRNTREPAPRSSEGFASRHDHLTVIEGGRNRTRRATLMSKAHVKPALSQLVCHR